MKHDDIVALVIITILFLSIGLGIMKIITTINADIPLWLKFKLLLG